MNIIDIENDRQVLKNVAVGHNVRFFNFVNAYGCQIGDNTKVGAFVEIQKGVIIGNGIAFISTRTWWWACRVASKGWHCSQTNGGLQP